MYPIIKKEVHYHNIFKKVVKKFFINFRRTFFGIIIGRKVTREKLGLRKAKNGKNIFTTFAFAILPRQQASPEKSMARSSNLSGALSPTTC
jgi:hypothetical protein